MMIKPRLFLISLLAAVGALAARSNETVTLTFSEDDFTYTYNEKGHLVISSNRLASYPETNVPGLPLFSTDIAVSGGEQYLTSTPTFTKRLVKSNVEVAQTPTPIPTDGSVSPYEEPLITYNTSAVYPAATCEYTGTSTWGDVKVLHFLTSPFVYNAKEKALYFIDSITLNVSTSDGVATMSDSGRPADTELLKSFVINPERVDELTLNSPQLLSDNPEKIEYVIITSEDLKEAFEPLREWKRIKGIYAEIITMEEVQDAFPDYSPQLALKSYLYELYKYNSLKYVLLGGDETVVPVQGCSVSFWIDNGNNSTKYEDKSIPTDLYYACFGGQFDWDGNGNGIYGEAKKDNIDLSQSIYVTRVPVSAILHVKYFVNKLLSYEGYSKIVSTDNLGHYLIRWEEPEIKWNNKMLLVGSVLSQYYYNGNSDAQMKGSILYNTYIAFKNSHWTGKKYMFYDTYTDFPGGKDYDVTSKNLFSQISEGYAFIDVITHGAPNYWVMEDISTYKAADAVIQTNSAHTIVTTMACETTAFDKQAPCLGEYLILGEHNGVISYLGCSRYGWYLTGFNQLGTSLNYEALFYEKLFSPALLKHNNYGALVCAAKAGMISQSSEDGPDRWVQFGLNPFGDPEMPIYTSTPKKFDNIKIEWVDDSFKLDTGLDECRVCIMSSNDEGKSFYKVWNNVRSINFTGELPKNFYVTVTKQDYIPKVVDDSKLDHLITEIGIIGPIKPIGPLGGITSCSHEPGSCIANVTTVVNEEATSANLIMRSIDGSVSKTIPIAKDETDTTIDISSLRAGLYVVSLYVDGSLADSCEMIK